MSQPRFLLASMFVALGIAVAGIATGYGFYAGRTDARYVTVKGLAEREVRANLALWSLEVIANGDDLPAVQRQIETSTVAVRRFVEAGGLPADALSLTTLEVTDRLSNPYQQQTGGPRFILRQGVIIRSEDVERVASLNGQVGELARQGVVLGSRDQSSGVSYLFTRLNDIKPEMLKAATANARAAAEQFAEDSGSPLGGIRRANQGVFVIKPRDAVRYADETTQIHKIVRVVSTVQYFLER
ncbi:MAG: SIMPL domain-containing protein [Pseudomonadota bacterium]|nr:SIMPL domain-containing protein [Pseudomonadota bacterium]